MPEFKSLSALESYLQEKVNAALSNQVAEVVKEVEAQNAEAQVYDVYQPTTYNRRYSLSNPENIEATVKNGTLELCYDVDFNSGYGTKNSGPDLAGLVEHGDGWNGYRYDYPGGVYSGARPFIRTTKLQVQTEGAELLKYALIENGLNVE